MLALRKWFHCIPDVTDGFWINPVMCVFSELQFGSISEWMSF